MPATRSRRSFTSWAIAKNSPVQVVHVIHPFRELASVLTVYGRSPVAHHIMSAVATWAMLPRCSLARR